MSADKLRFGPYALEFIDDGKYSKIYRGVRDDGRVYTLKLCWNGSQESLEEALRSGNLQGLPDSAFLREFWVEGDLLRGLAAFTEKEIGSLCVPKFEGEERVAQSINVLITEYFGEAYEAVNRLPDKVTHQQTLALPEPLALEIGVRYLRMLHWLHTSQRRYIAEPHIDNLFLRVSSLNAERLDTLDFRVLDWDNTIPTLNAPAAHPAGYNVWYAMAFLYEILTGAKIPNERGVSYQFLRGNEQWEEISVGTRQILQSVLSRSAGRSDLSAEEYALQLDTRLARWQDHGKTILGTKSDAGYRDIEDATWFGHHFEDRKLQTAATKAAQKAEVTRNRLTRAIESVRVNAVGQALDIFDDGVPDQALDLSDLRWKLALNTLQARGKDSAFAPMLSTLLQAMQDADWEALQENDWERFDLSDLDETIPLVKELEYELEIRYNWNTTKSENGAGIPLTLSTLRAAYESGRLDEFGVDDVEWAVKPLEYIDSRFSIEWPDKVYRQKLASDLLNGNWPDHSDDRAPDAVGAFKDFVSTVRRHMIGVEGIESAYHEIDEGLSKSDFHDPAQVKALINTVVTAINKWPQEKPIHIEKVARITSRLLDTHHIGEAIQFRNEVFPQLQRDEPEDALDNVSRRVDRFERVQRDFRKLLDAHFIDNPQSIDRMIDKFRGDLLEPDLKRYLSTLLMTYLSSVPEENLTPYSSHLRRLVSFFGDDPIGLQISDRLDTWEKTNQERRQRAIHIALAMETGKDQTVQLLTELATIGAPLEVPVANLIVEFDQLENIITMLTKSSRPTSQLSAEGEDVIFRINFVRKKLYPIQLGLLDEWAKTVERHVLGPARAGRNRTLFVVGLVVTLVAVAVLGLIIVGITNYTAAQSSAVQDAQANVLGQFRVKQVTLNAVGTLMNDSTSAAGTTTSSASDAQGTIAFQGTALAFVQSSVSDNGKLADAQNTEIAGAKSQAANATASLAAQVVAFNSLRASATLEARANQGGGSDAAQTATNAAQTIAGLSAAQQTAQVASALMLTQTAAAIPTYLSGDCMLGTINATGVQMYSQPGNNDVIGVLKPDPANPDADVAKVTGRTADGSWWQIEQPGTAGRVTAWVYARDLMWQGNCTITPLVSVTLVIVPPTNSPMPSPTITVAPTITVTPQVCRLTIVAPDLLAIRKSPTYNDILSVIFKSGDVLIGVGQAQQPDMLYWQVQYTDPADKQQKTGWIPNQKTDGTRLVAPSRGCDQVPTVNP